MRGQVGRMTAIAVLLGSAGLAACEVDATAARAALPTLFSIMLGLQGDMNRISQALWLGDFEGVATGAEGVAEHPEIPPEEAQQIAEVLGPDMSRFQAYDQQVHDLSVRLARAAEAEDTTAVLQTEAELRQACVQCHGAFRERLRDALP